MQALLPAARLHLARGDHDLARAAARRGLRAVGGDRLRAVELFTVLVDAELARGDVTAAAAACAEMDDRIVDVGLAGLRARAVGGTGPDRGRRRRHRPCRSSTWRRSSTSSTPSSCRGSAPSCCSTSPGCATSPATASTAGIDAKAAVAALATLDVTLAPADVALLERLVPPASSARTAHSDGLRSLATERGGWRRSAGRAFVCRTPRACATSPSSSRAPASSDTSSTWSTASRASPPPTGWIVGRSVMPATCSTPAPGRRTATASNSYEPTPTRRSRPVASRRPRTTRPSSTCWSPNLRRRSAWAAGAGGRRRRPSVLASTSHGRCAPRSARVAAADPVAGEALDRRVRTGLYCAYEPDDGDEIRWIVQSGLNDIAAR